MSAPERRRLIANSGIIHAGYDARTGTEKAKFNVLGNSMMDELAEGLDFEFQRNGSLVLGFSEEDRLALEELYARGIANGVEGLRILSGDEVRAKEPQVSEEVVAALFAPTGGIVCPFGMTIALAENAYENGVEFRFDTEVIQVQRIEKCGKEGANNALAGDNQADSNESVTERREKWSCESGYRVVTGQDSVEAEFVVNAAGVYSDFFHNMVSLKKIHINPRRGEYLLLDKRAGDVVSSTVFQLPGKYGKGVLVTPTVHGNLLVGPTATDQGEKDLFETTASAPAVGCGKTKDAGQNRHNIRGKEYE